MRSLLAAAISRTIEATLASSSDRIVRVIPRPDWPVAESLEQLAKSLQVRALMQKPFHVIAGPVGSTTDAGLATAWRNQVGRDFSVVVMGHPGASLDAGLHDIRIVNNHNILQQWKESVREEFAQLGGDLDRPAVLAVIDALIDALESRRLGTPNVTDYLQTVANGGAFSDVTGEMWRLHLFVDSHVLDSGLARSRVERNISLVDRLREGEEKLLQKLRRPVPSLYEQLATRVLDFLDSGNSTHLESIELSDIEALLFGSDSKTPPQTPTRRTLDLLGLLNKSVEHLDAVRDAVADLQDSFRESPHEPLTRQLDIAGATYDVGVSIEYRDLQPDRLEDIFDLESDPVVTAEHRGSNLPQYLAEANGRKLTLATWLERINQHASTTEFVGLRKRLHFLQHLPSVEDAFAILFLLPTVREDVLQYCQYWQSMVSEVLSSTTPNPRPALLSLQALEVLVDADESPTWLALSHLHPYRLEPLARVAEYCQATLLSDDTAPILLGDAAKWMLDRSIPAYPAFYKEHGVFHLASQTPLLVYRAHTRSVLPQLSDSRGLERVTQAIVSYSPWMHDGASILLIDPPPGRGVAEALHSLRTQLGPRGSLNVYHGQRRGTSSNGLADFDGDVVYLGNDWEGDLPSLPFVDVAIVFSPESETSHTSATESWSAAPGTHIVLNLSVSGSDDLFDVDVRPRVDVKPSSENGIVNAILELYKGLAGGRAPHAAIEPTDPNSELRLLRGLQSRAEWTVTARPGPFGLLSNGAALYELGYVGRAMSGRYLVSVFGGPQVYGVRRFIESVLRDTPVATIETAYMADRLVELARGSSSSLLTAARQPIPNLGELIGLDIASAGSSPTLVSVSLSMDDLGWTRAWLGQKLRPDFVVVRFDLDARSVVIRVVECKTDTSSERLPFQPTEPHIQEALTQVRAASAVLQRLFSGAYSLAEDLQFSSLIEHLFAVLLNGASMGPEHGRGILDLANRLAERSLEPTIEQWIFLSQPNINMDKLSTTIDRVNIVWLGAPEVHRLLRSASTGADMGPVIHRTRTSGEELGVDVATRTVPESLRPDGTPRFNADEDRTTLVTPLDQVDLRDHSPGTEVTGDSKQLERPNERQNRSTVAVEATAVSNASAESQQLAMEFIQAMQLHNAEVADTKPRFVRVGPSLVAIGVQLVEGSSLQPIRARLGDIAREVGLGDRERELWIENSSEPGVIQVLVPRPDRVFPVLPSRSLGPVHKDSYVPLFIGQTIDGVDYPSTVETWPHMLVAGTTGSGKTTLLRSVLRQLTCLHPTDLQIAIADGKGDTDYLGFVPDEYFPGGLMEVKRGADGAMDLAEWAIEELERRSDLILQIVQPYVGKGSVPKASTLYKAAVSRGEAPPIAPLVLVIDEFADIMLSSKKKHADDFMSNIQRLAQIGRSRLVHVLLATQRPDRNTIRGAVRANFDARIALRLPTAADSMTILGTGGAEKLMAHGDFLFRASSGQVVRLQGYSVD